VASGTLTRSRSAFPPGVARRLSPVPDARGGPPAGVGFTLEGEWANGTTRTRRASAVVVLRRARPKAVTAVALPFTDRSAEAGLLVAPGEVASTEALAAGQQAAWGPGRAGGPDTGACVLMVTGQMHKRGRFLGVDLIGADGTVENPAGGPPIPWQDARHDSRARGVRAPAPAARHERGRPHRPGAAQHVCLRPGHHRGAGVGDGRDGGAARVGRPVPDSLRSAGEPGRVRPAV